MARLLPSKTTLFKGQQPHFLISEHTLVLLLWVVARNPKGLQVQNDSDNTPPL